MPGATVLHANPVLREAAVGPSQGWFVTPADPPVRGLLIEMVTPHLEIRQHAQGAVLHLAGQAGPMPAGAPDLPALARVDPGRPGLRARVEILEASYVEIDNLELLPTETLHRVFQPGEEPGLFPAREPDPEIYARDAFWPPELARVEEAWMGTQKLVRTALHPVQYNPVAGVVRYYETLSARLIFEEEQSAAAPQTPSPASAVETIDPFACPREYDDSVLPPMNGSAADFAVRRAGAEVDAIYRIDVKEDGIYKVTQPELIAAGLSGADLNGSALRLYCRDREVAISTSTPGPMGAGDSFVFYGEGYHGRYTDANVYWLGVGGAGLRMDSESGAPAVGAPTTTTHYAVARYAPNRQFSDGAAPNDEEWDHFFATQLLTFPTFKLDQLATQLQLYHPVPGRDARVCVSLQGLSDTAPDGYFDHNTGVQINGMPFITFSWDGGGSLNGSPLRDSRIISSSYLNHGWNNLWAWQRVLGFGDQVYVESISLVYPRSLLALGDGLQFPGDAGLSNYLVDGFSSIDDLWLLDTSDPARPVRITGGATAPTGNGHRILFSRDAATPPGFAAGREADFRSVLSIDKVPIRGLGEKDQQADYIMICPYAFRAQAYRMVTNRYLRGQSVVVAPVEDIYNEFSYGVKDVAAIRQFLGYAFHHWDGPPPRYVLLIGDGTYDPREYLAASANNIMPVHFGGTPYTYAAQDVWLTLVNGDDILADMVIGRIPVSSPAALNPVANKIFAHENTSPLAAYRKKGLIAQDDEASFAPPANDVFAILSTNGFTTVDRQIAGAGGSVGGVLNAINANRYAVAFFGHGSHTLWADPVLLRTSDVKNLVNSRYPIVTATTCINGYFVNLNGDGEGLSEALLERSGGGSVAGVAGTALSQEFAANQIAVSFFDSVINHEAERLGDAMAHANLKTFEFLSTAPELLLYQVFGDPGMVINPQ